MKIDPRPPANNSYTIDYEAETLTTSLGEHYQYSYRRDLSDPAKEKDPTQKFKLTPNDTEITYIYIFKQAIDKVSFRGFPYELEIKPREEPPTNIVEDFAKGTISIDDINNLEYRVYGIEPSDKGTFNDLLSNTISMKPNLVYEFVNKASTTLKKFRSKPKLVVVNPKRKAPSISIDYLTEKTNEPLSVQMEYNLLGGDNTYTKITVAKQLELTPFIGNNSSKLKIRYQANPSSLLASEDLTLDLKARPQTPKFTIDFVNERILEPVSEKYSYAFENKPDEPPVFADYKDGKTDQNIEITPYFEENKKLYILEKAIQSVQFKSLPQKIGPFTRPDAPTMNIEFDYIEETTSSQIAKSREYSTTADFSDKKQGMDFPIKVTPGTTLYIRNKAKATVGVETGYYASKFYEKEVPNRPPAPSDIFTINLEEKRLQEDVPITIELSYDEKFNSANILPLTDNKLQNLEPSKKLYFRFKAKPDIKQFASESNFIQIPDRPDPIIFTVNYAEEKTNEILSKDYEYSFQESFVPLNTGKGEKITVQPNSRIYIRRISSPTSFGSEPFELVLPSRPVAPNLNLTVNYITETTDQTLSKEYEYSRDITFKTGVTIAGSSVKINPGGVVYIRTRATTTDFASMPTPLRTKARPTPPNSNIYYIDFIKENMSWIGEKVEYAENYTFANKKYSTSVTTIKVTPATSVYYRFGATSDDFASEFIKVDIPDRPPAPQSLGIDFRNERTIYSVPSYLEMSKNPDFIERKLGDGKLTTDLEPGKDLYFRVKATAYQFSSKIYKQVIPKRPIPAEPIIDFKEEKVIIANNIIYAINGGKAKIGAAVEPIEGGDQIKYNLDATVSTFASKSRTFYVPSQPMISDGVSGTKQQLTIFNVNISIPNYEDKTIEIDKLILKNIKLTSTNQKNVFKAEPLAEGVYSITLPANFEGAKNFEKTYEKIYEKLPQGEVMVYPNPTQGIVQVNNHSNFNQVKVYSLDGNLILQKQILATDYIDLSPLVQGNYLLRFQNDKGQIKTVQIRKR